MSFLKQGLRGWMRLTRAIGRANAFILMTAVYFTLMVPLGIAMRLFADPLRIKKAPLGGWTPADPRAHSLDTARRQY